MIAIGALFLPILIACVMVYLFAEVAEFVSTGLFGWNSTDER
jgi:hypothetical protein